MIMLYGVVAEWNTKDHMKREHSLTKPYIGNRRNSLLPRRYRGINITLQNQKNDYSV